MAAEGVLVPRLTAVWILLLLSPLSPFSSLSSLAQARPSCPRSCSCPGQKEVHCTFRHLTSPPRNLPRDTERVNLGYNSLQEVQGSEFTHLRQLEMLMLHGNDIRTVSQGAFYSLRSLQILKLSYNKLTTISPGMLEGLVGLTRLHLDHNTIDFIQPYSFTGLRSLKLLQLEGNRLADLHPHTFVTLSFLGTFWASSLRHLHLSDNRLQFLQAAVLQPLARLEMLTLHGNPWTCDCQLLWLLDWNSKHEGVIKCKKERESGSAPTETCAACSSPPPVDGAHVLGGVSSEQLACRRPSVRSPLKQWDVPGRDSEDDSEDPDLPYTRDLERPLGRLTFVLSDSHGNSAHVACDVRRPGESGGGGSLSWSPGEAASSVNVSLATLLECEIDREALQNLWRLVAYYYESAAILERGPPRDDGGNATRAAAAAATATFRYAQVANEESPYFTDLKGHLTAEPAWLLAPRVTLQLNRRQTTSKKLVMDFTALVSGRVGGRERQGDDLSASWALIRRGSEGRLRFVPEGSEVNLECDVVGGEGRPAVEWMLPDHSVLEESTARQALSESGGLVIANASLSDSGLYHCLVRTPAGVDMAPVRLTIKERVLGPNALNGNEMTVASGESLSLPCSVTSALPSFTGWFLPDHRVLLPSQRAGRASVTSNGTLVVRQVGREDAGEYSCVASNLYGADTLSHLLVVTGDTEAGTRRRDDLLLASEEEVEGEDEGSGFQEIKRPLSTQSPKRFGGGRPGAKGKRVKENKRKPNKSVKELDPDRWAEILAKANAKATAAPPTAPPLTVPPTKTATTMTAKTTTTTTAGPPGTTHERTTATSNPPTESNSKAKTTVIQTSQSPLRQTEDRPSGEGRVTTKIYPGWPNRRRPPHRRVRPPLRRVRPLDPSLPSSRKPQTTVPQPTTTTTTTTTAAGTTTENHHGSAESDNGNPKMAGKEPLPTISTDHSRGIEPIDNNSTRQRASGPKLIPTLEPNIGLHSTEVYTDEQDRDSSTEELATTKPPPDINHEINIKPPSRGGASVPTKPGASGRMAEKTKTSVVRVQDPPRSGTSTGQGVPSDGDRERKKAEENFKPNPGSPSYPRPLPVHPWIHQHNQRRGQTTEPSRQPYPTFQRPSLRNPGGSRIQVSAPLPVATHRPQSASRQGSGGVTNRPETIAETAKPTAFIPGGRGAPPPTPHVPLGGRTRDLLLLSKLRNRYRQAQLDRIAQLGRRATPGPGVFHPTPRPHLPAPTAPAHRLRPAPTSSSVPGLYSTASAPYGRWNPPPRRGTALPFPGLMGNGAKPRITTVNGASVSALAESDVFLPCGASGEPSPSLSWTKVSTGATIPASTKHGPRFEVLTNGTLVIKNVQLQDRGQYLCAAQNRFGSDRAVLTLAVLTQPPKIVAPLSTEVPVYLGKPIALACLASGKPPAQISWILPDRTFVRDVGGANDRRATLLADGTLSVRSANFSSNGDYKCIASNAAGADTVTYRVRVAALPPSIAEGRSESVAARPGGAVYAHCSARGEPAPALRWTLPAGGAHVKPSQFLGRRLFVFPNGTLYIRSVLPADAGRYECSAANAVGVARRTLSLEVRQEEEAPGPRRPPPPAFSPAQRHGVTRPSQQHAVTAMYGATVYLHCPESTGSLRGTVWQLPSKTLLEHRYSPERPTTVFPNGTLRILQLTELDRGSYLCMFQRPNGEDVELFHIEVLMTPPRIERLAAAQKRVTYGENFQVDCVASGLPDPEVTWGLPDGTVINNALQSDDSGGRPRRYIIFGNGTLLLQRMGKTDEGDYTCYAKNKLGEDERKVSVKVGPEAPRIAKTQLSLTARLGESASLACRASGEPPPSILWLSPDNEALAASSAKHQVLADGTLVIRKVTAADQGKYTCVARNSAGDDAKRVTLEAEQRAPRINGEAGRSAGAKTLAVSYGTALLECGAEGEPEPRVAWTTPYGVQLLRPYLGGRVQVHANGSLELRGVRKSDEGRYLCAAANRLGEASLAVELEVASLAEKPSFAAPNIEIVPIGQDGGGDVALECPARGKPRPEFVWILPDGTALSPGARLQRFAHHPANGTLRITRPAAGDKGVYRCLAKNAAGLAEKRYALEDGRKPVIRGAAGSAAKATYGHGLDLPCAVDGWPTAAVTWTLPNGVVLDKPQAAGRVAFLANGTLRLRELATFDRGTYVCKAANAFGSSALSYPVAVAVHPPRITAAPASVTRVSRGSPATLSCVAAGIPKPDITWTLPGRTTLVPNNRYTTQGGVHMTEEGSLVIQDPGLMNSGIYKCNAKNALGTDFKATYVQVI